MTETPYRKAGWEGAIAGAIIALCLIPSTFIMALLIALLPILVMFSVDLLMLWPIKWLIGHDFDLPYELFLSASGHLFLWTFLISSGVSFLVLPILGYHMLVGPCPWCGQETGIFFRKTLLPHALFSKVSICKHCNNPFSLSKDKSHFERLPSSESERQGATSIYPAKKGSYRKAGWRGVAWILVIVLLLGWYIIAGIGSMIIFIVELFGFSVPDWLFVVLWFLLIGVILSSLFAGYNDIIGPCPWCGQETGSGLRGGQVYTCTHCKNRFILTEDKNHFERFTSAGERLPFHHIVIQKMKDWLSRRS